MLPPHISVFVLVGGKPIRAIRRSAEWCLKSVNQIPPDVCLSGRRLEAVGFPALASTSMEQGRLAARHICDEPATSMPGLSPYGIYSIPEISMVGKTEAQLTAEGVPYECGVAQYREIARGQLLGDDAGMLKLLIHEQTRRVLGVHAIGAGARS